MTPSCTSKCPRSCRTNEWSRLSYKSQVACAVPVRVFWTGGRLKHQAALRLSFSRARAGLMYPCRCEEPTVVGTLDEGPDHRSDLLEGREIVQVDALFLEGADEALGDTAALRLPDIGGRRADTKPFDLGLELPCPVLRAPVVHPGRSPCRSCPCGPGCPGGPAPAPSSGRPSPALRLCPEPRRVRAQSSSGLSVRIPPLWVPSPRGCPPRTGASRPCTLMRRSTGFLPTRIPLAARRAFTFR